MLAIPPNRQSVPDDLQTCDRRRLLVRSMRIAAVLAVLVQCIPANAEPGSAKPAAKQSGANAPQAQQNAIRFIALNKLHVASKPTLPPQAPPVLAKPTNPPPVTVADYQNYIKQPVGAPRKAAQPAPLSAPVHDTTHVAVPSISQTSDTTSAVETSGMYFQAILSSKSQQERNAILADTSPATSDAQPVNHSVVVSPLAAEPHVAMLEQAPHNSAPQPTKTEPKEQTAVIHTEAIPIVATDGVAMPLTNSSYLPANPETYCFRCGVKCPPCGCNPGGPGWAAARPIPWEVFAQGEYVGPARLAHVPVYRLRVDDQLAFVYRLSGQVSGQPYRLNVRDRVLVQSLSAPEVINREAIVEPDGTITLPLLGQVRASGATLDELRSLLDEQFKQQIRDPRITVTPLEMNSNLQELRSSVDRRYGQGGQVSDARISPDGTVQLPAIGSVPAQGLTLDELEREIKARYAQIVEGLEVTPILTARAPRFVYVVGEVSLPGRYSMEGPTTLMQAIALAGSWNVGAQLNHVVVFRRDENWQLMATTVNIRESLLFKKPCPSGEIWLRDSDIVLVPKSPILCADDMIDLIFTRGIYGVFPMSATLNFAKASTL